MGNINKINNNNNNYYGRRRKETQSCSIEIKLVKTFHIDCVRSCSVLFCRSCASNIECLCPAMGRPPTANERISDQRTAHAQPRLLCISR